MTKIDDLTRLRHMRDATAEILTFLQGQTKADLEGNRMLQLAVIKDLEIIGEAANNISADTKTTYPGIPWRQMIGMRNRLVHAYFGVNVAVVWQTAQENLPNVSYG
ncbi:DUF86 domain-containing protein [[Limnothrix rosea] IAM M-220]|uniref:HepT-like ribonuclease domain-containing protein n=1 Tax=[Limnothrix rosea] IAM M-220 TaxID=454133 RepID=UPI0009619975|nr:DUF86 domain-containing protein [[Limnothrix rosea] IAM M-220]OKH13433.1 hypothetical protein NIES208_14970 [[Limnothrix rosea] IAM M-220]